MGRKQKQFGFRPNQGRDVLGDAKAIRTVIQEFRTLDIRDLITDYPEIAVGLLLANGDFNTYIAKLPAMLTSNRTQLIQVVAAFEAFISQQPTGEKPQPEEKDPATKPHRGRRKKFGKKPIAKPARTGGGMKQSIAAMQTAKENLLAETGSEEAAKQKLADLLAQYGSDAKVANKSKQLFGVSLSDYQVMSWRKKLGIEPQRPSRNGSKKDTTSRPDTLQEDDTDAEVDPNSPEAIITRLSREAGYNSILGYCVELEKENDGIPGAVAKLHSLGVPETFSPVEYLRLIGR